MEKVSSPVRRVSTSTRFPSSGITPMEMACQPFAPSRYVRSGAPVSTSARIMTPDTPAESYSSIRQRLALAPGYMASDDSLLFRSPLKMGRPLSHLSPKRSVMPLILAPPEVFLGRFSAALCDLGRESSWRQEACQPRVPHPRLLVQSRSCKATMTQAIAER